MPTVGVSSVTDTAAAGSSVKAPPPVSVTGLVTPGGRYWVAVHSPPPDAAPARDRVVGYCHIDYVLVRIAQSLATLVGHIDIVCAALAD